MDETNYILLRDKLKESIKDNGRKCQTHLDKIGKVYPIIKRAPQRINTAHHDAREREYNRMMGLHLSFVEGVNSTLEGVCEIEGLKYNPFKPEFNFNIPLSKKEELKKANNPVEH